MLGPHSHLGCGKGMFNLLCVFIVFSRFPTYSMLMFCHDEDSNVTSMTDQPVGAFLPVPGGHRVRRLPGHPAKSLVMRKRARGDGGTGT